VRWKEARWSRLNCNRRWNGRLHQQADSGQRVGESTKKKLTAKEDRQENNLRELWVLCGVKRN
jgi:hypothetical protein